MKQIVLWSGGADSTLLLHNLAKHATAEEPVEALTVITEGMNETKQKSEAKARDKIKKKLKHLPIKYREIKVTGFRSGTNQAIDWLCAAFPALGRLSELNIGYCFEDSVWHRKTALINAFESLALLYNDEPLHKLSLPFEWKHKKEIVKELEEDNLLDLIWTCENPEKIGKTCDECYKCKELTRAKEDSK